jgi:hypothetical protein
MRLAITTLAALLFAADQDPTVANKPKTTTAAAEAILKEFDRNDDRMLNADEYPKVLRSDFSGLDANHDGRLSVAEIARGFESGKASPVRRGEVVANCVYTVADDFIVDVYLNGEKVDDNRRTMMEEIYGATVEKIDLEIREGDWLVFNVVNNRLRWGGCSYFAAAGIKQGSGVAFVSEAESGRWLACDDPADVPAFLAYPDGSARQAARPIEVKWDQGDSRMNGLVDGWKGTAVWGRSRNTWIKFVVREPKDAPKP